MQPHLGCTFTAMTGATLLAFELDFFASGLAASASTSEVVLTKRPLTRGRLFAMFLRILYRHSSGLAMRAACEAKHSETERARRHGTKGLAGWHHGQQERLL